MDGQMLLAWAIFNRVEDIIDHHLLELRHVRDLPAHVPLYDWRFLLVGGILPGAIGWWMSRDGRAFAPARRSSSSSAVK